MVFVIVPFYNSKNFIRDCVDSILKQTYLDILPILIDDCSTDGTSDILKRYGDKIIVLKNDKNMGVSYSRNYGLKFVRKYIDENKGLNNNKNFIMFVDSDDTISIECISNYHDILVTTESDIVCGQTTNNPDNFVAPTKSLVLSKEDALIGLLKNDIFSFSCVKLYKTDLWIKNKIFYPEELTIYEDLATIYKTFFNSDRICLIDSKEYFYRENTESAIRTKYTNKKMLDMQSACVLRTKFVLEHFQKLKRFEEMRFENFCFCIKTLLDTTWNFKLKGSTQKEKEQLISNIHYYKKLKALKFRNKNAKTTIKYCKTLFFWALLSKYRKQID